MTDPIKINRAPIFKGIRMLLGMRGVKQSLTQSEVRSIDLYIDRALGIERPEEEVRLGLTREMFEEAGRSLGVSGAVVRAIWEVEAGGRGWFADVADTRGDILELDGPGGFIDGQHLPKILFEAHWFSRFTDGRFNDSHPNLSSPRWNRSLYVGGLGEWERLHRAMLLDREAALKSASVGGPQIMGFNFDKAGFTDVEAFWDAMKGSEEAHLNAFVSFIINSGLMDELRLCNGNPDNCRPFARGYNGSGYEVNNYHGKIAAAVNKWTANWK